MEDLKVIQDHAMREAAKIADLVYDELRRRDILLDGNLYRGIREIIASALVAKALADEEETP